MMDQFLNSLPKTVVAIGAIVIGFFLIIAMDPPKTVCDSQMELFKEAQKGFIYSSVEKGIQRPPLAKQLFEICQNDNSPGGCFEYFERLKKLAIDLNNVPRQCSEKVASDVEVQQWLFKSMKLMAQIAWGERAPAAYTEKHGWFDASDIALYCDLRSNAIRMFGDQKFSAWREGVIQELPQSNKLTREQLWPKTIFSTPCDSYR